MLRLANHLWLRTLALGLSLPALAIGQTTLPTLCAMVPDAAVVVVEIAEPRTAVPALLQALGGVPPGLRERLGVSAWAGLAAAWVAVDGDPTAFATKVAGGGAVFALVPTAKGPQPVLLLRPHDLVATEQWFARFAKPLARAVQDGVVVVATDPELTTAIAARAHTAPGRWANVDLGASAAVRGAFDLAALRRSPGASTQPFAALDAGARLLLAPLAFAATSGELVQFAIAGGDQLQFTARTDTSVKTAPVGDLLPAPQLRLDVPLAVDGLLHLRLDRCLRTLLTTPERFLQPAEVLGVQGFLSIADAIDGAHTSFVDDLLGGLGEPFELYVLPVTPPLDGAPPRLQLPGFALVAPITNAAAEPVLFRMAQAFAVIANAERAQRGLSLFPVRTHKTDSGHGLVAEPLAWRGPGAPPIEQALSPTLWSENGHIVLASTHAAAMTMVAATKAAKTALCSGDRLLLRGPASAQAIAQSRSVFELGRMLDEGEGPSKAARFFDILLLVVAAVREVEVRVACDARETRLTITMERGR